MRRLDSSSHVLSIDKTYYCSGIDSIVLKLPLARLHPVPKS